MLLITVHMPTITLQSVTGVDVELRIAGPGSRSYAFVIDWHIRIILAIAWLLVARFIASGSFALFGARPVTGWSYLAIVLPAAAIYFLYHPILEIAMHGRTPGKRMAGVRIVSRSGDIPGAGALLIRNVFRLIDSLPFLYLVGLTSTMFTAHQVRIGDLAAGTLLVHDETDADKSFAGVHAAAASKGLSPQSADLINELLERWNQLDASRNDIARQLLARVDRSLSAETLAQMTESQLHARLAQLLKGDAA